MKSKRRDDFSREREKREKKREKQKSEHPPKTPKSLFFLSVVFEFFFFLDFLILFPSVRVRYLLYNKRTRRLFGTLYYDYKSTLLLFFIINVAECAHHLFSKSLKEKEKKCVRSSSSRWFLSS